MVELGLLIGILIIGGLGYGLYRLGFRVTNQ